MIALILETIDKFSQYKSKRQFAYYAGEEAANKWDDISSYLYLLLGMTELYITAKFQNVGDKKLHSFLPWDHIRT